VAQRQQGSAAGSRTSSSAMRGGGIRILRSPAIAHMKEIVNLGQTSNRRFRIKRR
jgi:hypothetical protein